MTEPGSNEELFSLIIVSNWHSLYMMVPLNLPFFGSGFNDGLGRQDVKRMCCIVHKAT